MREYYSVLLNTSLFKGFCENDLDMLMGCFAPVIKNYEKSEIILLAGYENKNIGIVLEGEISAIKTGITGTSITITHMQSTGIFGDVLSAGNTKSPVTVVCEKKCKIMFLPYSRVITTCAAAHSAHSKLLQNLVSTISDKYFLLNRRMEILMEKSLRKKIAMLLLEKSDAAPSFNIGFNRNAMADYLSCERTALSRELARMKKESIIDYKKSVFYIKDINKLMAAIQN